jgi:hypothetical protein
MRATTISVAREVRGSDVIAVLCVLGWMELDDAYAFAYYTATE